MDPYTLCTTKGFCEGNITAVISDAIVAQQKPCLPAFIGHPTLYDDHPPPEYPYTHAPSAYSATIQLYGRSQQLDSAYTLSTRLKAEHQPWCRFGCNVPETSHHIFTECPRFAQLRSTTTKQLWTTTSITLQTYGINPDHMSSLASTVDGFFTDPAVWPTRRAFYYIGVIPKLNLNDNNATSHLSDLQLQRMEQRIAGDLHTAAIRLAGRIWGAVRRTFSPFPSSSSSKNPLSITLPSHLTHIASSSSRLLINHA